jgi:hypothetical protein
MEKYFSVDFLEIDIFNVNQKSKYKYLWRIMVISSKLLLDQSTWQPTC